MPNLGWWNGGSGRLQFPFVHPDFVPTAASDSKENEEYTCERKRKCKMTMKRAPPTASSPAESSALDFILKLTSLTILRALNSEKRATGDIQEDSNDDRATTTIH